MAIPRRGLRDVRTHSGLVDQLHLPHRTHIKVGCLEMEKLRRGKERKSASRRIADIDARLKEIEVEESRLLDSLPQEYRDEAPDESPAKAAEGPAAKRQKSAGGLKFRY